MPRIPFVTPDLGMSPEQRRVYDAVASGPRGTVQGPILAALHRPELADKWQQLGELLRYRTSLPLNLSEVAILVTAQRWRCQLEWHLHKGFALKAQVSPSVIDDIHAGRRPASADADTLIIHDFAAELQDRRAVSEDTYQRALTRWGTVGVVELTALIGYYTMVAMTLNAHEFPLPAGAEPPFAPVGP
ncbi:MAG: carboxymuconolactone decarboxylase family protein [Hyphomicrobiales bacterium]|nr:carboxymuconolactone decarboxylase family protein [Hyphomicrobiales bacterium]